MPFPQNRNAQREGGQIPPARQPVRRFTTPSVGDGFYAERVDVTDTDYEPLKRGTLYSTIKNAQKTVIEQFPRLYFLKETLDPYFWPGALRLWATDEDAESTYNAEVTYLSDDVNYPVYARTYTLRREAYEANPAIAQGQPLSGIIAVRIDAAGVGYTKDDVITFGATAGIPAEATLVVDEAGSIINVILTVEGTQYAGPPAVTVASEAGVGATLTAIMQDQTAILISQKKVELADDDPSSQEKVRVLRVYQTLPGPYITSTKIDENGDIMTETRRQVLGPPNLVTTNNITAGVWTKTFGEPVGDSDYISWEVVQVRNTQNPLNSYSIEIPDLIPVEFRSQLPVLEHAETVIGTASASVLGVGDLFHEQKQLDAYTYRETIRGRGAITLPQTVTNTELTEEYGGGVLNVTITLDLFDNLTIDQGLLVVDSSIKKLDSIPNGLTVKTTKQVQGAAWPIIIGTEVDPRTGIVIGITKQVVGAGAIGGVDVNGYHDVKPIDKWRSLTIASKLNPATLPAPVIWETTIEHSFPNTLQGATWIWAAATAGCCSAFDMALELDMDQGYAGPCRAKVTESFTDGPPDDVISITQFFPKAHMIGYAWAFASISEACGDSCRASAATFGIPPSLHEAITIAGSVILDGGTFTSTLAATVPTGLPAPGTLITKEVDVERWRFGIFFRRTTEIYVPG